MRCIGGFRLVAYQLPGVALRLRIAGAAGAACSASGQQQEEQRGCLEELLRQALEREARHLDQLAQGSERRSGGDRVGKVAEDVIRIINVLVIKGVTYTTNRCATHLRHQLFLFQSLQFLLVLHGRKVQWGP